MEPMSRRASDASKLAKTRAIASSLSVAAMRAYSPGKTLGGGGGGAGPGGGDGGGEMKRPRHGTQNVQLMHAHSWQWRCA